MASGFAPAGYYSDESDDDGFDFGDRTRSRSYTDDYESTHHTSQQAMPTQNGSSFSSQSRGGFGQISKPSKPIVSSAAGNDLTVDDFRAAVMKGNVDIVKRHLDSGIDVDTILKSGWTPLMYAASCSNIALLQLLLDNGADVNFSNDRFSVLMAACGSSRVLESEAYNCVELLLTHGATVSAHDRYHMSPLIYAAREGRSSVVKKLLDSGAYIDKQDNRGWTALVWAASKNNLQTIQVLLDAGADVDKMCVDGQKAVDMAPHDSKVAALLSGQTAPTTSTLILTNNSEIAMATGEPNQPVVSAGTQSYVKFGDLELLLSGLQLRSLIPVFQQHQVTMEDLLKMTDHDLQQLGISQLGYRKKILDGLAKVHKKDWEKSSLTTVQYGKQMSCPEAIAMLANISKHIGYLGSTVAYVRGQLKTNPHILKTDNDGSAVDTLYSHGEKTLDNIGKVYREVTTLQQQLAEMRGIEEYKPPDLIRPYKKGSRRWLGLTCLGLGSLCVAIYWHRDSLNSVIKSVHLFATT